MNEPIFIESPYNYAIDLVEAQMQEIGTSEFPVGGFFTPGAYTRVLVIPEGSYLTSKIHKTTHPFVLAKGKITIFTEGFGEEILEAPFIDITLAGTRRFARAETECVWVTFHATDKHTVEEVEEEIIIHRENPLLKKEKLA
jgi:hypothetical protein